MPNVLFWGKTLELVGSELPAGMLAAEVSTFEEIKARIDPRGTFIIAHPDFIEAHHEALGAWIKSAVSGNVLLVAVAEPHEGDDLLKRFPFIDDLLVRPITAGRLRLRLDRAYDALHNRRVVRQLEEALERKGEELHELNKIGVALSAERDIDKLLQLILEKSREITAADAGSLYLVQRGKDHNGQGDDLLRFKLTQNDSILVPFEEFTMPLSETSIAGYVALTGTGQNVADAYSLPPGSPFRVSRSFDETSGYRTKSMLVVPMRDHKDEVIGVVQLINKKRDHRSVLRPVAVVDEQVISFTAVDQELVTSLASQAAVALENTNLLANIKNLFETFVTASVVTIEKRDPASGGHSQRVAVLTVGLAEQVDRAASGLLKDIHFTRDQIQEIRYASLLHDFGKVAVKEKHLIKAKKLYWGEEQIVRHRFAYIKRTAEAAYLRSKLDQVLRGLATPDLIDEMDRAHNEEQLELDQVLRMVLQANEPSILEEDRFQILMDLPKRTFPDLEGTARPFLEQNEVEALSIRKGSLTTEEREHIQDHVTHTYNFLKKLPWTSELARVPEIAYAHHEKLDGSGYPRKLLGASAIPVQSRMMTISDIYDALVAWNRPYKKAVPPERALAILKEEAAQGKLESALLDVFIEAKIYQRTPPLAEAEVAR